MYVHSYIHTHTHTHTHTLMHSTFHNIPLTRATRWRAHTLSLQCLPTHPHATRHTLKCTYTRTLSHTCTHACTQSRTLTHTEIVCALARTLFQITRTRTACIARWRTYTANQYTQDIAVNPSHTCTCSNESRVGAYALLHTQHYLLLITKSYSRLYHSPHHTRRWAGTEGQGADWV